MQNATATPTISFQGAYLSVKTCDVNLLCFVYVAIVRVKSIMFTSLFLFLFLFVFVVVVVLKPVPCHWFLHRVSFWSAQRNREFSGAIISHSGYSLLVRSRY